MQREQTLQRARPSSAGARMRPRDPRKALVVLACFFAAAMSAGAAATRSVVTTVHSCSPPADSPDLVISPPHLEILRFGACVAAHENTLAIASPTEGDLGNQAGRIDVLTIALDERGDPHAVPFDVLIGNGGGDHFGSSLALTAHPVAARRLLLVGADGASLDPNGSGGFEGAVHLYESRPEQPAFIRRATVHAATPEPGAEFGRAVAWHPSADAFAVGAHRHDYKAIPDAGSVTVFIQSGHADDSRWKPAQEIHAASPQMSDWFGASVSMGVSRTGDWLAIGAPGRDLSPELRGGGAVLLYRRTASGAYDFVRTLVSPRPRRFAWFGTSLAIEAGRIAVGEPRGHPAASEPAPRAGAAWIFELDAPDAPAVALAAWPAQDGAGFGQSVVMSHGRVVVGAPGFDRWNAESGEPIEDNGRAFVFSTSGEPLRVLETAASHPSALFAPTAAILDLGRTHIAALGHLYTEEESPAPSPGVALFAITTDDPTAAAQTDASVPIPRTTWPGSAASRRHARSR